MAKKTLVPQAKAGLEKFKMEAASEVGVNLSNGYNGNLTAREAGSIGGQMVNKICPVRTMKFTRNLRNVVGHKNIVSYSFGIIV